MGFIDRLKKLLGMVDQPLEPAGRYADYTRKTKTGRLRAKVGAVEWEGKLGTDWAVLGLEELSNSAKKVYRYLSAIADRDGYCFPFYRTIARRTQLSESTVSKAIKELEEFGLITRQQRVSRRGGSSNLYHVKKLSEITSQKGEREEG